MADLAESFEELRPQLTRVAYAILGSARRRRETYVGEWLPEPVVGSVVGRSPAAVRQLAARARAHVEAGRPLQGAERIARALAGLRRASIRAGREAHGRLVRVNGSPGIVLDDEEATSVVSLTIDAGRTSRSTSSAIRTSCAG